MQRPDAFDVDALRLPPGGRVDLRELQPQLPPRHRPGGKFLRGPVPWDWLEEAGRLPGKALLIGLLLWKEAGCERRRTVRFRLSQARATGIHPDTARRGLRHLERAGLVGVERPPGRCLLVTLRDAPTTGGQKWPTEERESPEIRPHLLDGANP